MTSGSEEERWARDLRVARGAASESELNFSAFVRLAELASLRGQFGAKTLLATITSHPEDNGEGEAVLSVLAGVDPLIRTSAIVEELPRLLSEGEGDWAESIVETEARFEGAALVQAGNRSQDDERRSLTSVLAAISEKSQRLGRQDFAGPLVGLLRAGC